MSAGKSDEVRRIRSKSEAWRVEEEGGIAVVLIVFSIRAAPESVNEGKTAELPAVLLSRLLRDSHKVRQRTLVGIELCVVNRRELRGIPCRLPQDFRAWNVQRDRLLGQQSRLRDHRLHKGHLPFVVAQNH